MRSAPGGPILLLGCLLSAACADKSPPALFPHPDPPELARPLASGCPPTKPDAEAKPPSPSAGEAPDPASPCKDGPPP